MSPCTGRLAGSEMTLIRTSSRTAIAIGSASLTMAATKMRWRAPARMLTLTLPTSSPVLSGPWTDPPAAIAKRHVRAFVSSARYPGPICVPATGTARSASFGVPAAVKLQEVGVVAAAWLCDAGVLAAVQLHDTEAAPGDQLAQAPHPAHARERDSYGGGEDRAAKQREPADDVPQHHHDHSGQQGRRHDRDQEQREQRHGDDGLGGPVRRPLRVPTGHHDHLSRPRALHGPGPAETTRYVASSGSTRLSIRIIP